MKKFTKTLLFLSFILLSSCSGNANSISKENSSNTVSGESSSSDTKKETIKNYLNPQSIDYSSVTYSTDNRCEDYFEYELNDDNETYCIVDIKKEYSYSDKLYIPLTHNSKAVNVLNMGINKKYIFEATEIYFPETFSKIINIYMPNVVTLVLPRYLDSYSAEYNCTHLTTLILPEKCKDFHYPTTYFFPSITYPKDCETIYIPSDGYFKQIIIPECATSIVKPYYSYYAYSIVEVYCLSDNITNEQLYEAIPTLKSVKRSLNIQSNIFEVNNLLFYKDEKTDLTFLGGLTKPIDVMILPSNIDGETYGIEPHSFDNIWFNFPSKIVVPSGLKYIKEYAFVNCKIFDVFFEDEIMPEEYEKSCFVKMLLGINSNIINYHMGGTWHYVDDIPTVIE